MTGIPLRLLIELLNMVFDKFYIKILRVEDRSRHEENLSYRKLSVREVAEVKLSICLGRIIIITK